MSTACGAQCNLISAGGFGVASGRRGSMADAYKAQLQYERAVNERYRVELRRRMEEDNLIVRQVTAQTRSSFWTGSSVQTKKPPDIIQPLIGRVALAIDDDVLGRNFYIGSYFQ